MTQPKTLVLTSLLAAWKDRHYIVDSDLGDISGTTFARSMSKTKKKHCLTIVGPRLMASTKSIPDGRCVGMTYADPDSGGYAYYDDAKLIWTIEDQDVLSRFQRETFEYKMRWSSRAARVFTKTADASQEDILAAYDQRIENLEAQMRKSVYFKDRLLNDLYETAEEKATYCRIFGLPQDEDAVRAKLVELQDRCRWLSQEMTQKRNQRALDTYRRQIAREEHRPELRFASNEEVADVYADRWRGGIEKGDNKSKAPYEIVVLCEQRHGVMLRLTDQYTDGDCERLVQTSTGYFTVVSEVQKIFEKYKIDGPGYAQDQLVAYSGDPEWDKNFDEWEREYTHSANDTHISLGCHRLSWTELEMLVEAAKPVPVKTVLQEVAQ